MEGQNAPLIYPISKQTRVQLSLGCRRASETDGKAREKRLARALLDLEKYKALLEEAKVTVSNANMIPRAELDKALAGAACFPTVICHLALSWAKR
jgi:hypothetical protein